MNFKQYGTGYQIFLEDGEEIRGVLARIANVSFKMAPHRGLRRIFHNPFERLTLAEAELFISGGDDDWPILDMDAVKNRHVGILVGQIDTDLLHLHAWGFEKALRPGAGAQMLDHVQNLLHPHPDKIRSQTSGWLSMVGLLAALLLLVLVGYPTVAGTVTGKIPWPILIPFWGMTIAAAGIAFIVISKALGHRAAAGGSFFRALLMADYLDDLRRLAQSRRRKEAKRDH